MQNDINIARLRFEHMDPEPILDDRSPGAEHIRYGYEGGRALKDRHGVTHIFCAEVSSPPVAVGTHLAHWRSADGIRFERVSTLFQSSGDFTGQDPRGSLYAPMPIFDQHSDLWRLFYIAYHAAPDNELERRRNHHGRVVHAVSEQPGIDGLAGPYRDVDFALEPGRESDWWEGVQGTDSFFAWPQDGRWLAFYGSNMSQYWSPARPKKKWYGVGLAEAASLTGPWQRLREHNPVQFNDRFIENPIVTPLDGGGYLAVYDGGSDAFCYASSPDGLHWSREQRIPWDGMKPEWFKHPRTPLGLVPEGDGRFTMYYTAFHESKFIEKDPDCPWHSCFACMGRAVLRLE
jgi:hypothetical protein